LRPQENHREHRPDQRRAHAPRYERRPSSHDKEVRRAPRFIRTLVATRELLTDERKWTTIACAVDRDGEPEGGPFEEAAAFSFAGALMKCGGMPEPEFPVAEHVGEAMGAFLRTIGGARWGDGVRYTENAGHAGMLDTLDQTIGREMARLERSRGGRR
jgi:hypothetical protein